MRFVLARAKDPQAIGVREMYAMKTSLTTLIAAAALAAPASAMTVVYENDFESGAAGPEWSKTDTGTSPTGENFLGNFGRNIVELTLTALPAHNEVTSRPAPTQPSSPAMASTTPTLPTTRTSTPPEAARRPTTRSASPSPACRPTRPTA